MLALTVTGSLAPASVAATSGVRLARLGGAGALLRSLATVIPDPPSSAASGLTLTMGDPGLLYLPPAFSSYYMTPTKSLDTERNMAAAQSPMGTSNTLSRFKAAASIFSSAVNILGSASPASDDDSRIDILHELESRSSTLAASESPEERTRRSTSSWSSTLAADEQLHWQPRAPSPHAEPSGNSTEENTQCPAPARETTQPSTFSWSTSAPARETSQPSTFSWSSATSNGEGRNAPSSCALRDNGSETSNAEENTQCPAPARESSQPSTFSWLTSAPARETSQPSTFSWSSATSNGEGRNTPSSCALRDSGSETPDAEENTRTTRPPRAAAPLQVSFADYYLAQQIAASPNPDMETMDALRRRAVAALEAARMARAARVCSGSPDNTPSPASPANPAVTTPLALPPLPPQPAQPADADSAAAFASPDDMAMTGSTLAASTVATPLALPSPPPQPSQLADTDGAATLTSPGDVAMGGSTLVASAVATPLAPPSLPPLPPRPVRPTDADGAAALASPGDAAEVGSALAAPAVAPPLTLRSPPLPQTQPHADADADGPAAPASSTATCATCAASRIESSQHTPSFPSASLGAGEGIALRSLPPRQPQQHDDVDGTTALATPGASHARRSRAAPAEDADGTAAPAPVPTRRTRRNAAAHARRSRRTSDDAAAADTSAGEDDRPCTADNVYAVHAGGDATTAQVETADAAAPTVAGEHGPLDAPRAPPDVADAAEGTLAGEDGHLRTTGAADTTDADATTTQVETADAAAPTVAGEHGPPDAPHMPLDTADAAENTSAGEDGWPRDADAAACTEAGEGGRTGAPRTSTDGDGPPDACYVPPDTADAAEDPSAGEGGRPRAASTARAVDADATRPRWADAASDDDFDFPDPPWRARGRLMCLRAVGVRERVICEERFSGALDVDAIAALLDAATRTIAALLDAATRTSPIDANATSRQQLTSLVRAPPTLSEEQMTALIEATRFEINHDDPNDFVR